jgi:zinc protease
MRAAYLARHRATETLRRGEEIAPWLRSSVAALVFAWLCAAALVAQQPAGDLNTRLPLDKAITTGTLPNGLTFYIRKNGEPDDRAMLRLAVKAGSIDEADDQRGLAHVLEHMAFNGSKHFPPGELVKYLESIGAQFGPHVNAYTSFDETVYMLDVPVDKAGAMTKAFEAMSDFAGGIALDGAEIDKERGVVLEEWRGRLGASERMLQPQMNALFGGSKYANRNPIGTPESLKSFPHQRLRDFYRDHYRPDRMAIIVVGDIDPAEVEKQIRTHFGVLPAPAAATRPPAPIPSHQDTRFAIVMDREAQGSSITVYHKHPRRDLVTIGDYRRTLVNSLMFQMINARLGEIAREPNAPFLAASAGEDTLGRALDAFVVAARVQDGTAPRGLTALGRELARVRQHGFGEAELGRAKATLQSRFERLYNERDKTESPALANELVRHFLIAEGAPGIEAEVALVKRLLPTITAAEIATAAREYITESNRVVLSTAPERAGLAPVSETALSDALDTGLKASVEPWKDGVEGRELLAKAPSPGTVTSRREIPEIGVTVLTLSNGVEVWLKPTTFRNDQISFTSYSRGGVSLAGADDYVNASLATSLVGLSGIGGLTPVDMSKLLAGKLANVSPAVGTYTHGMAGATTPRDLETALQLLYLQFTAPNRDPAAFALLKQRLEASLANQAQNPGTVFGERARCVNTVNHYTCRALKVEDVAKLDAERMHAFYQQLYANAADFTFFMVGSFKVDEVVPLLQKYVASLPSKGSSTARLNDLKLQFPENVVREVVYKGQDPRSQTVMSFFADTKLEEFETHRLQAATTVVENRLREILREQLGGTYSVGVGYSNTSPVPGYGTTSVQFGSSPENVEKLQAAVMAELDRLRKEGPTAADVQAVKETEKNSIQEGLRENGYWQGSLQSLHLLGRDPLGILRRIERADSLNQQNIHDAIRKYFPVERHTIVTLMPEAGKK